MTLRRKSSSHQALLPTRRHCIVAAVTPTHLPCCRINLAVPKVSSSCIVRVALTVQSLLPPAWAGQERGTCTVLRVGLPWWVFLVIRFFIFYFAFCYAPCCFIVPLQFISRECYIHIRKPQRRLKSAKLCEAHLSFTFHTINHSFKCRKCYRPA